MSSAVVRRAKRDQRIQVYNPTMYTDSVEVGGVSYHFAPRGFAECVCADHKNDNVGVHASYDWPRDKRGTLIVNGLKKVAADGEMTADTVAEMIVGPDCRGGKFFVIVEGTDAERKATMREAETKWARAHIEEVEQVITAWERDVREQQLSQPGALPPRQSPSIQEAYRFRRMWNENKVDRSAFVCLHCGHDAADKAALDEHVIKEHPGIAADRGLVAVEPKRAGRKLLPSLAERVAATNARAAEDVEETVPGEGPGAEVDTDSEGLDAGEVETGDVVQRRAQRTGVDLTPDDVRGLAADDPAVIESVQARIRDTRDLRKKMLAAQQAKRQGATAAQ